MAGFGGPPPRRSEERRRTNKDIIGIEKVDVAELASHEVERPVVDPAWHPVAKMWYESLGKSAQAVFYEPSDWATAHVLAESISRDLKPQFVGMRQVSEFESEPVFETVPMKGASLSAYLKGMSSLLATEGDRRRLRIEVTRANAGQQPAPAGVTNIRSKRRAAMGDS